jgi:hypothetical protein
MLSVQCKECNKVIVGTTKVQCCGCPNMMKVTSDSISAIDLSKVLLLNHKKNIKYQSILTKHDLEYQENRRKRKVRRLDFEER